MVETLWKVMHHKKIRVHQVHVRKTMQEPEPASADSKIAT